MSRQIEKILEYHSDVRVEGPENLNMNGMLLDARVASRREGWQNFFIRSDALFGHVFCRPRI